MENWFNQETEKIMNKLNSNLEKGLTEEQVKAAREKYGYNELEAKKKKTLLVKFLEQFKDFMIIVLIVAVSIWCSWCCRGRRNYRYNNYISSCCCKCNNWCSTRK